MLIPIWGILLSLPILCLCPGNQSPVNICGPVLFRVLMVYWWVHYNIICSLSGSLATSFCRFSPVICDLLTCWPHRWSSIIGAFLGHKVCLGPLFQSYYTVFLHWSNSYLWMLLPSVPKCGMLHPLRATFHPLLVEDLLWNYLYTSVCRYICYFYCRMTGTNLSWWLTCLFIQLTVCGIPCSFTLHWLTSLQWPTHLCSWWWEFAQVIHYAWQ